MSWLYLIGVLYSGVVMGILTYSKLVYVIFIFYSELIPFNLLAWLVLNLYCLIKLAMILGLSTWDLL